MTAVDSFQYDFSQSNRRLASSTSSLCLAGGTSLDLDPHR